MSRQPEFVDIEKLKQATANAPAMPLPDAKTTEMLLQLLLAQQAEAAQAKISEKERKEQSKKEMRSFVESNRQQRIRAQAACSHKMPKGENAIFGQVHNDGLYHPRCVICQKEFTPYRPYKEDIQNEVSV